MVIFLHQSSCAGLGELILARRYDELQQLAGLLGGGFDVRRGVLAKLAPLFRLLGQSSRT
jgi:hypothetical protein